MDNLIRLSILVTVPLLNLLGQGPFQFREAYLLENRIQVTRSGEEYDPAHSEVWQSSIGPSPARQFISDVNDLHVYSSSRWMGVLGDADKFRRMGGFEVAEKRYLLILEMLRKAQGEAASDVALMLDHLGEFYLEMRDFEKAYERLSQAAQVRRKTLAVGPFSNPSETPNSPDATAQGIYHLHLADLLTRLGQMDLAKGDLARAGDELSEAIKYSSTLPRYVGGLYSVYFGSLVLEKQGKWQEAEDLWKAALKTRDKLFLSDSYWNAMKEMAAYYARKGDFHAAAELAQRVKDGTAGKTLRPELPMPYLDSRPRAVVNQPQYSLYTQESNTAMSEILALDKWHTAGPEAAAALLPEPIVLSNDLLLDRGNDSDRSQLIAWFEQRVFQHMSILLDGQPSQDRIDNAYRLLRSVKGRYLGSTTNTGRLFEGKRGNGIQDQRLMGLDQLADLRQRHARLLVSYTLDRASVTPSQFAAIENQEGIVSAYLASDVRLGGSGFSVPTLFNTLGPEAAFIDFVQWQRTDRKSLSLLPPEYGAFVFRKDQPLRFVQLGPSAAVDADIDMLAKTGVSSENIAQAMRRLHAKVIAPLQGFIPPTRSPGVTQLFVVPDGKLALAPLGGFLDAQGHYVLERYKLTYGSSWRDVDGSRVYGQGQSSAPVVVANPDFDMDLGAAPATKFRRPLPFPLASVPDTAKEAKQVANSLGITSDRVLVGAKAREQIVRDLIGPEVLHFATHTFPNLKISPPTAAWGLFEFPPVNESPLLQSFIAMAGANREQAGVEDGLLTGLEVASLHLSGTKLVVLSSCESGQVTAVNGQGLVGLRSAVSMAGADGLVTSLWKVDDDAGAEFMSFFYSHWKMADPAEALRLAQLDMKGKYGFRDWAGYQYSGSWRPSRGNIEVRPKAPNPESISTPACVEASAHETDGNWTTFEKARFRLGAVVRRVQSSPTSTTYEMLYPGSEVEYTWSTSINHGPPVPNGVVRVASGINHQILVTIENQRGQSSLTIQELGRGTPVLTITLKGPPTLFPSLEIPQAFPPLGSYTEATLATGGKNGLKTIDSLKTCGTGPLR